MDIMGESETVEPLDLTDVKSYLALSPTDESVDGLLTQYCTFARQRIEPYLPFWLAEREATARGRLDCMGRAVIRGPVQTLRTASVRETPDDDWEDLDISSVTLDGVLLDFGEDHAGWEAEVSFRTGSRLPAPVQNAMLMMVRNLYTDRTADPLTPAVASLIAPYRRRL